MTSYLDMYRKRIFLFGENSKERIENNLSRDFTLLLRNSPNKVLVKYKDKQDFCILSSGSQNEKKVFQYLMTNKNFLLPEGAAFETFNEESESAEHWLILHKEIHSYYGYYKYKVLKLNSIIKYVNKNGELKEVPVYISGSTENDIKEYFRYINLVAEKFPNKTLNLILSENEDFVDGLRITIGKEVWEYIDSDKISIPGVYYSTFNKTTYDPSADSFEEMIADIKDLNSLRFVSNYGESIATIDINTTNLKFYLYKEDKLKNSNIVYEDFNKSIVRIEDGIIIPIAIGETEILLKDTLTNFCKKTKIIIKPSITNYFYLIGNFRVSVKNKCIWEIFTDQQYSVIYDRDMISISQNGSRFEIKTKSQMGTTEILFLAENKEVIFKQRLEITSLWV